MLSSFKFEFHISLTHRRRRHRLKRFFNMSSACTPHRLVGRRVRRKLASCFFARRIRLEGKTEACRSKSPETSNGSIVFDFTGGGEGRRASERKCKENEEISVQNSPSHSNRISGGEAEPHAADEDYLVFRFGEDGAIDIINDGGGGSNGGEHENLATAAASQKGDEDDEMEETKNAVVEHEERNLSRMERFESCDSNLSDTSSGSFAFPILKLEEWIGSPVYMPKNGSQSVRLHCCNF